MSTFDAVLQQYQQLKEQITLLDTLTEIAMQLKRIADASEKHNAATSFYNGPDVDIHLY